MENAVIFSLQPLTPAAHRVVQACRQYGEVVDGIESLSYKADKRARRHGRLATFCRTDPDGEVMQAPAKASPTTYRVQCSFSLVSSGELLLEDGPEGSTHLEWEDEDGVSPKYSLQGNPRCRIIPRAPAKEIRIRFGQDTVFRFIWRISTQPGEVERLARVSEQAGRPRGDSQTPKSPGPPRDGDFEAVTEYTPRGPQGTYDRRELWDIHAYRSLGKGAYGDVFEAVDLAHGRVFAVKQSKPPSVGLCTDSWKYSFTREVEVLLRLDHANIIPLHHHQGWTLGQPVQLFFPIYDGSVVDILPRNVGYEHPRRPEPWIPAFIRDTLAGLGYMHQHDFVHHDIKPDNILYKNAPGGPVFVLADFGLAMTEALGGGAFGTIPYLAPESTRHGVFSRESDVYSFGVTLLEALGFFHQQEAWYEVEFWRQKLLAYSGCGENYQDTVLMGAAEPRAQPGHARVQSLLDYGIVPQSLCCVLDENPTSRSSAWAAAIALKGEYPEDESGSSSRITTCLQQ